MLQEETRRIGGLVARLSATDGVTIKISYSYVDLKIERGDNGYGMVDEFSCFIAKLSAGNNSSIELTGCFVNVGNISYGVVKGYNYYLFAKNVTGLTVADLGYYNIYSTISFKDELGVNLDQLGVWGGKEQVSEKFEIINNTVKLKWENLV